MPDIPAVLREALGQVQDPCCKELGISILDMGLVRSASVEDGIAEVELILTSGWCPFVATLLTRAEEVLEALPAIRKAQVRVVWDQAWSPDRLSPTASAKLRFLPPPKEVSSDRAAHRAKADQEVAS